jgi:uncharacterized protein (DUF934 family)
MGTIIHAGAAAPDTWTHLTDDQALPAQGPVTVSWARWLRDRAALSGRPDLGVLLSPEVAPEDVAPDAEHFALIAVDFPKFTDGRGYTTARMLRDRFGYTGPLRAVGDVLPDQLAFMQRCGFDSFALKSGKNVETALRLLAGFSVKYQPAADQDQPLWKARLRPPEPR